MKRLLLILPVILLLLTSCAGEISVTAPEKERIPELTVRGEGKVAFTPDICVVNIGVEVRDKRVKDAQDRASKVMEEIFEFLTGEGIAKKDIKTIRFSINPIFENSKITGYRVYNLVRVRIRDMDKAGEIIDGAVQIGGDLIRIGSISFTSENMDKIYEEARKKAVENAIQKAEAIADAAGIRLKRITYISEESFYPPPVPIPRIAEVKAVTPISPGEMEIRAQVIIKYEIED